MRARLVLALTVIIVVAAAASVLFVSTTESTRSFRQCVSTQAFTQQTHASKETSQTTPKTPEQSPVFRCAIYVIDRHNGLVAAIATVLLFIVTAVLVFLAFLQFKTTRAQLRAYVLVEGVLLSDGPTSPDSPIRASSGCPSVQIVITNSGQTPAFNVRHWAEVIVCKPQEQNVRCTLPLDLKVSDPPSNPTVIGPGARTTIHRRLARTVTPDFEIPALRVRGVLIVVFGKITYDDAFKVGRVTTYRTDYGATYRGGSGISDTGISGFQSGHCRREVHAKTET